ncbi:MAG: response regulator transcription factor [Pikeienuella sp.]
MAKSVLLVEDEPHILEALRFLLERDGFTVTACSDGDQAIATARTDTPDIVILDVMLPGRNGFEILRDMRASTDLAEIPVLMLTAKGQSRDRETAMEAGANRFVTKPFSNEEIVAAVRELAG